MIIAIYASKKHLSKIQLTFHNINSQQIRNINGKEVPQLIRRHAVLNITLFEKIVLIYLLDRDKQKENPQLLIYSPNAHISG